MPRKTLTLLFSLATAVPMTLHAETEEKPAETPLCVSTLENCVVEAIRKAVIDVSCKKNEASAPPVVERMDADPQGTGIEQPCKA